MALVLGALSTKLSNSPVAVGPETTAGEGASATGGPDALAPTQERKEYPYNKVAVREFPELFDRGFTCYGLTDPPADVNTDQVLESASAQSPPTLRRPELTSVSAAAYDCILTCLPPAGTWSSTDLIWAENCINTNISQLPDVMTAEEYFKAAEVLLHDYPQIAEPCHVGAHAAGQFYGMNAEGRFVALLQVVPSRNSDCQYGFMHGVIDAVGYSTTSEPVFTNLARYCATLEDPISFDCAHAVGHAAWDAFKTAKEAVTVGCGEYSAYQRMFDSCSSGIVMRRFERSELGADPADVDELVSDGVDLCSKQWPKRLGSGTVNPVIECWRNIPYQMWFPISQAQKFSELSEAGLEEYIVKVTSACMSNASAVETQEGGASVNACDQRTGNYLERTAEFDEKRLGVLCGYGVGDKELCRRGSKSVPA
jgi:hypothetical protein